MRFLDRFKRRATPEAQAVAPGGSTAAVALPISSFTAWDGYQYGSGTIRAAIDSIARHGAKLKGSHIVTGGEVRKPGDASINRILQTAPNPHMSAYDCLYKLITHVETRGNGFALLERDARGNLAGVWPIDCTSCDFMVNPQGELFTRFRMPNGGEYVFAYADVAHIRRHYNANPLLGEGNDALGPTMEAAHAQDEGIVAGIEAGASIRGVLQFSQILSPEKREEERRNFIGSYLAMGNNSGVVVLDQKMAYQSIDSKPLSVDAEQMAQIERRIYSYFGTNEKIINSTCDEAEFASFYESIIEPLAIQLSQEFTRKIFTPRERAFGNEIVFEGNRLQYGTLEHKAQAIERLVPFGLLSINQALEILNMPPVENGDRRLQSLNYAETQIVDEYQLAGKTGNVEGDEQ